MHTNLLLLLRYIYYLLRLPFNLLQTCPCLSLYCFPRVCLYFYLEGRSSPIIRVPKIFVFLQKQKKNIFSKYLMHLVLGYHENIFKTIFFIHISQISYRICFFQPTKLALIKLFIHKNVEICFFIETSDLNSTNVSFLRIFGEG